MEVAVGVLAGFLVKSLLDKKKTAEAPAAAKGPAPTGNAERTYIMAKPDAVQRNLVAEIIDRFTKRGYKLIAIKMLVPSKELASKHYAEHDGKPFFPKLVSYLSGNGPVVGMVFEGKDVIKVGRAMIGATNPLNSAPGTIRGDLSIDTGRNAIHGSDSVESAEREISLWFPEGVNSYAANAKKWIYEN